jgi:hypothetical protein
MNKPQNIQDKMRYNQELQDHLALVRERIEDENLSVMELRLKARALVSETQDTDLLDEERELAQAELGLVNEMVDSMAAPEATPEEVAAELAKTNPVAAETLQFQIALEAEQQKLADALSELAAIKESGQYSEEYVRRKESESMAVRERYDALPKVPPAIQRENDAAGLVAQGKAKQSAAAALSDSTEPSVVEESRNLLAEAEKLFDDALTLRETVPTVGATGASITESEEGDVPPHRAAFERHQMLAQAQMRRGY